MGLKVCTSTAKLLGYSSDNQANHRGTLTSFPCTHHTLKKNQWWFDFSTGSGGTAESNLHFLFSFQCWCNTYLLQGSLADGLCREHEGGISWVNTCILHMLWNSVWNNLHTAMREHSVISPSLNLPSFLNTTLSEMKMGWGEGQKVNFPKFWGEYAWSRH